MENLTNSSELYSREKTCDNVDSSEEGSIVGKWTFYEKKISIADVEF